MLNICLAAAMAVLWFFSMALYGVASHGLGAWGVELGWPVFMSVIVIGAGLLGIATVEWSQLGTTPVMLQSAGILLLVMAIVAFSLAQHALPHSEAGSVGILLHSAQPLLGEGHEGHVR